MTKQAEKTFEARLAGIADEAAGKPSYPALATRAERVAYWLPPSGLA